MEVIEGKCQQSKMKRKKKKFQDPLKTPKPPAKQQPLLWTIGFVIATAESREALLRNWKGVIGLQSFLIRFVAILERRGGGGGACEEAFWLAPYSCGWPNDALETLLRREEEEK